MKPRKKIPTFRSEDAERAFWAKHDSAKHVDWSEAGKISAPKLRPILRSAERIKQERSGRAGQKPSARKRD